MAYIGAGITRFNTADELTVTGDAQIDGTTLVIDSTNNRVGIGTSSPSQKLSVVESGGSARMELLSGTSGTSIIDMGDTSDADIGGIRYENTNNAMLFRANNDERLRIDSSGHVLVNNTAYGANGTLVLQQTADSKGIAIIDSAAANTFFLENDGTINRIRNNASVPLTLETAGAERMRIDSSGDVGIGTSSPAATSSTYKNLQVGVGATVIGRTDDTPLYLSSNLSYNSGWKYISNTTATQIALGTNIQFFNVPSGTAGNAATLTERMRIDTSGNLLVGTTDTTLYNNTTGGGFKTGGDLRTDMARQGDIVATMNRTGNSDGTILQFRKDGTDVGSIGVNTDRLFIGDSAFGGIAFPSGGSGVLPAGGSGALNDNTHDLGNSSTRFKDLYLSGGAYLGGTGSANKLDDYEEGTYTPVLASTSATFSYSVQQGTYVKIGQLVYLQFNITLNANPSGTTSNVVFLDNVPFNTHDVHDSLYAGGHIGHYFNINLSAGTTMVYQTPIASTNQLELKEVGDNIGENSVVASELQNGSVIRGSVMYRSA